MRSDSPHPNGGWLAGLRVYLHPRVLAMLFLGFSAGLPFPLVFATLSAWLAIDGISKGDIGMFAWVGLFYALKFAWAPLVDATRIAGLTGWLGRRRSWMLLAQLGIVAALLAMATSNPAEDLARVAWLALAVAFCSATQDIVIDAYRIEAVDVHVQGAMAASYQFGYRAALLAAGAGALYIADLASWRLAYQAMAGLMAVGMVTVLLIDEPMRPAAADGPSPSPGSWPARLAHWFSSAVAGPFVEFFRRNGYWAVVLLLLISCYRISDYVLGVMANPFYIDIGFTLPQIATVTKVFGLFVGLAGIAFGGVVVARYGVEKPLVVGAVLLAVTNLFFASMAIWGADMRLLVLTISADNFALGFSGTVFIAYLSSLTNTAYTATQYALFTSLMALPGKIIAGFSGQVVEAVDWFAFFVYASAFGVPAIVLSIIVARHSLSPASVK